MFTYKMFHILIFSLLNFQIKLPQTLAQKNISKIVGNEIAKVSASDKEKYLTAQTFNEGNVKNAMTKHIRYFL